MTLPQLAEGLWSTPTLIFDYVNGELRTVDHRSEWIWILDQVAFGLQQ